MGTLITCGTWITFLASGKWIFRHGTATPVDVLSGIVAMVFSGFFLQYFGRTALRESRTIWHLNIRGYVLWTLTNAAGHTRRVVTPRGCQLKLISQRGILVYGEPLSGWWHTGQVWFDRIQMQFEVRKVDWHHYAIMDPRDRQHTSQAYNTGDKVLKSSIMALLYKFPKVTCHGSWGAVMNDVIASLQALQDDQIQRGNLIREQAERINQLEQQVELKSGQLLQWESLVDFHFDDLMNTSRLVFTTEGQEVTRELHCHLLVLPITDELHRRKYIEAVIPPTRGKHQSKRKLQVTTPETV